MPPPVTAGNPAWRAAMRMAGFKMGWVNRTRCTALKRDGTPFGRLAMTRYGVSACGSAMSIMRAVPRMGVSLAIYLPL